MSESTNSDKNILHKIIIFLLIAGNTITLISLFLLPSITKDIFLFKIGAYLFITGIIITFTGIICMLWIAIKLLLIKNL
ncbi:hypothetical protein HY745_00830 [Candidatus Desantisbacteria bacterium]|nr:hypothetical protein [Candidatus Desantisbacteria bacterium]